MTPSEREQKGLGLELIAASLALPIIERKMNSIHTKAFGGFSTISPEAKDALGRDLEPWRRRHRELLSVILGSSFSGEEGTDG